MQMKMILASNNQKKLVEMQAILSDLDVELVAQREAGCDFEVEENGETFEENSFLKAKAVTDATGEIAVADDSGLMVDALGGAPGVHSARFTGRHEDTDEQRYLYLLNKLDGVRDRRAKFVCCITCTFPNGDVLRARGECPGSIALHPIGNGGFGYDPVFCPDGYNCTMAELGTMLKNEIAHRGKALRMLKQELTKYYADK